MKTVFQTDADGWFIGTSPAFESPLEPGVFHLPAGAFEDEPPQLALPEGHAFRRVGNNWLVQPVPGYGHQAEVAPDPTAEDLRKQLTVAVQAHLNAKARELGYDNIMAAVSYAEEPAVPQFQAEGRALRAWRSLVWAACMPLLDEAADLSARGLDGTDWLLSKLPAFKAP